MWKAITLRRPLRRREDKAPDVTTSRAPPSRQDHPFADLMAKLDKIPYRRTRKPAFGGR